MDSNATPFLHNGTMGDVVASLPAMNEYYKKTGKKATLYLENGRLAKYYAGATHPTRNEASQMVMLNPKMIEMLIPLFKAQPCIEDCRMWNEELIGIDLNKIREAGIDTSKGCISRWYFWVFPDLACDLTEQWLVVPETDKDLAKGKIIISRSERYLNEHINYSFLKKYEPDLVFIGTEIEHTLFKLRFGLNLPHLIVNDFLELAQAISQSRFHISNQTMAFQISQGLKHPRILEMCSWANNVIPVGEDAYDFLAQPALEYYTELLNLKYK